MQIWPRFGHENLELSPGGDGHVNHAERRADSTGSQCARIALRHHAAGLRHQRRAVPANRFVGRAALLMNLQRLANHRGADFVDAAGAIAFGFGSRGIEHLGAALDGPEKIDRRRPVFASSSHIAENSWRRAGIFCAADFSTPIATPIAAAMPMAGAPRITMSLIAAATSR